MRPELRVRRPCWRARIIVALFATVLAFCAGELLTRMLARETAILFPRYHTGATYGEYQLRRLRPKTTFLHTSADGRWAFTTNAQGFRDRRDWTHERTPGVGRVLVLGDSQTQGFECRQDRTYCAILERRLRALGKPTEVLNTGVSGFGTAEQLAFLENEGLKYRPDAVVLGWFANDLDDNVKAGLFAVRDGKLVATEKRAHQPGVAVLDALNRWAPMRWLSEHSYFYSLLFNRVWEWRKGLLTREANASVAKEFAGAAPTPDAAVGDYQRLLAAKLVERMAAVCRQNGVRFVIAEIPAFKTTGDFDASPSAPLLPAFREHCYALLPAEEWLGPYRGLTDLFVAHGQQHISETTHLILGVALAEKLAR
ncbi:MAG: GDSL-type esterase/lipase family protein [Chthoniobacteraceae bacterium]